MKSESQSWSLCPSPGPSLLFCFSFVIAKPQGHLSTLPIYLENTNVHSKGQFQILPNIWSSERSTGHFSRSKQTRAQPPPFQCYPCVIWLYTLSLTKPLWENSLCFWPWLLAHDVMFYSLSQKMLLPCFPEISLLYMYKAKAEHIPYVKLCWTPAYSLLISHPTEFPSFPRNVTNTIMHLSVLVTTCYVKARGRCGF